MRATLLPWWPALAEHGIYANNFTEFSYAEIVGALDHIQQVAAARRKAARER